MEGNKEKLFSLNKKDFEVQTFQSGGKGGQHQNKTDTGVRIIHRESGAVGECRNYKSQKQNKTEAFRRLTKSYKFNVWINKKVFEAEKKRTIEASIEEQLKPEHLKVEIKEEGKWKEVNELMF